jgi:putative membrane protein
MNQLKAVCAGNATCVAIANGVIDGVNGPTGSKARTNAAIGGLDQVSTGLGTAIGGLNTQLIPGMQQISSGLSDAKTGVDGKLIPGAKKVKGGLGDVRGGLDDLAVGVTKAVAGVGRLDTGASSAYSGSDKLTNGIGRLDDGAGKLSDGAGKVADGTGKASDGGSQVADGAGQLSDGLGDAGDGSALLFGGLTKAAGSAPALPEGAKRLSDEGTKKLVAAGESTASSYGEMVSVIKAGAERGSAEKMAYGAPEDAAGLTAYSYTITGEDGESGRNLSRALGGLAVFGAAGGLFLFRRRLLV